MAWDAACAIKAVRLTLSWGPRNALLTPSSTPPRPSKKAIKPRSKASSAMATKTAVTTLRSCDFILSADSSSSSSAAPRMDVFELLHRIGRTS
mmetsp:Transcript_3344/g.6021  ORF Transcript_3344/g.6021 Transcript_3344/m.6021 type:complete len:93 (+) Transcript_3344:227-505(+)